MRKSGSSYSKNPFGGVVRATESEGGIPSDIRVADTSQEADSDTPQACTQAGPSKGEASKSEASQVEDLRDRLMRLAAEYDNYRKRSNREIENARQRARIDTLRPFLSVLDDLGRALEFGDSENLEPVVEGVRMVAQQFLNVLNKQGVEAFTSVGRRFDPKRHDAVSQIATDDAPEGIVLDEIEKGYLFRDELLRPAKVVVAAAPTQAEDHS